MARPSRRSGGVVGLYKICSHSDWDVCTCPYWGRCLGHSVRLDRWAGHPIPDKAAAVAVLTRMRTAVESGVFSRQGERSPTPRTEHRRSAQSSAASTVREVGHTKTLQKDGQWLTPSEVAAVVQTHVDFIYQACASGALRYVKLGWRTIRIKREWIDDWLERYVSDAGPAKGHGSDR
jgi:excisionase family DNA binding protein